MKNEIELASRAMYKEFREQRFSIEKARQLVVTSLLGEARKIDGKNRLYM
jgi:hypothetical protein